ncbi:uncharacterized protein LOC125209748, partial [Salvia hispanica]|uniref:uncharacterized protein LOC125209748 n=1 Tax=Salvia hispanica TaxID=49212 RepID=UPI002009B9B8
FSRAAIPYSFNLLNHNPQKEQQESQVNFSGPQFVTKLSQNTPTLKQTHENFRHKQNPYAQSVQQAFYYLEKAVDQLHPDALYLLGAVYLTGDCVSQDIPSAIWCFHRASEKGHAASAIAYGSLLLAGVRIPESVTKFNVKKASSNRKLRNDSGADEYDPVEMARDQFEIAANAGCDLGLKWLKLLDEEEKKKTGMSS